MLYAIIMAGGSGTRLWPVSRDSKPKQLLPFLGKDSLLQKTYKRINKFVPERNILITAGQSQLPFIKKQLPPAAGKNLSIEPCRRDTGPAFALAAAIIEAKNPKAVIVNINSDAYVLDNKEYARIINLAESVVKKYPDHTLSIGIVPNYPETGYGYIKVGRKFKIIGKDIIYNVDQFKEKPDIKTAEKFITSGRYLWNPTLFMWRVDKFMSLLKQHQPEMFSAIKKIQASLGQANSRQVLTKEYNKIKPISIDYALIEKLDKMLVIPADFGWSDIGHWQAIKEILSKNELENLIKAPNFIGIDTYGSLVYSPRKKLVATIGLKDIIIVDTRHALLVCDKKRSQEVKKVVERLKTDGKEKYL